jgi:uncharacterized membrane protein YfhO
LPRAAVYYNWITVPPDDVYKKLVDRQWNPSKTLLVSADISAGNGNKPPSTVKFVSYTPQHIQIEADAGDAGVLLLNDLYDTGWRVFVDGKESELLCCNAIMRGVRLPAGKHEIIFTYHPYLTRFMVVVLTLLMIAVWGILRWAAQYFGKQGGK